LPPQPADNELHLGSLLATEIWWGAT
jgi:hypothetical protein